MEITFVHLRFSFVSEYLMVILHIYVWILLIKFVKILKQNELSVYQNSVTSLTYRNHGI